ncbi:hypothetical protein LIER_37537 [Lithospermum erythrorhizon]|uniref:Cotton fiber protein n=1 Tax=Lithospermum erythrorhizon TaxID=34254 RepID=A0AAV3PN56_LITER
MLRMVVSGRSNKSSNNMRVAKHKRHETLDSTWRMITEGRNMKNTNTFQSLDDENHTIINSSVRQNSFFRKSATFKDRTNVLHEPPAILLRKEPSLGKEELNLRVEAFINKFNEEMRLQRQESLQRYMEMVKRGAN